MQSGIDQMKNARYLPLHRDIVDWISPTDYPSQQSDIISRRHEGTCQWFLDAPEFIKWLNQPKGTLFCPGIPGAGKTMMAAITIDYLLKKVCNGSIGVAYVYCNYKRQVEQTTSSMLQAIVKQLVQARPSNTEFIKELYKQHNDRGTRPCLEDFLDFFKHIVASYATIYVVVDALDECSDSTRPLFLDHLRDLQTDSDIRLMATSRLIPDIGDQFKEALRLEVRATNADVRRFISGRMYQMPRCIRQDPSLQNGVKAELVRSVDGM